MPASTLDPVKTAIRNVLIKNSSDNYLNSQLSSSAHRVLCTKIEFEPAESYQTNVLNDLKSKYIVLQPNNKSANASRKYESAQNSEETVSKPQTVLYPLENVKLGWTNPEEWSVGAGMMNMGNTCYLNSTLQALFHVPALVNWLLSDKQHLLQCENNSGGAQSCCIICAVSKTLQASQVKNSNAIRPWLVYSKLRLVCRHLIPGRQEDAHEFLRYLVEAMEKAYILRFRNLGNLDSRSKETTPLNQILGGYLRSTVRCLECGHVSTTFQHFQDLLVDIRKGNTLDEALDLYFSKEKLDDMAYHCDHCKKKVIATKQFTLERAPMVLCIQLKRFSISNNKITKQITFKPKMDLTRFARQKPVGPLLYQLVAIVTHMGPTVGCGHYTAVARAPSGSYYVFDDSTVRQVSQQTVLNTNAYIMLYEAIRPHSNANSSVSKHVRTEQNTETESTKVSTIVSPLNGLYSPKNQSENKKQQNGNGVITNGTKKHSDTSDSDDSDKDTSNNKVTSSIIPLPFVTSQNFSSNGSLGTSSNKAHSFNLNHTQHSKKNGTDENNTENSRNSPAKLENKNNRQDNSNNTKRTENDNFTKKWENKYVTNDSKKAESSRNTPAKSENKTVNQENSNVVKRTENDIFTKKWENKYISNENGKKSDNKIVNNDSSKRESKNVSTENSPNLTKLVPYEVNDSSSSSSSEDSHPDGCAENTIVTKASAGSWKVSSIQDKAVAPSLQGNSGWKARSEPFNELIKMSNEGYAAPVSTWNGSRPQVDRQIANERREERKRCMADNEDRGKVKHARTHSQSYQHSNPGYNPFQEYSNNRRWNNEPNKNIYVQKHRYSGQRRGGNHHYNNNNRYRDKFRN